MCDTLVDGVRASQHSPSGHRILVHDIKNKALLPQVVQPRLEVGTPLLQEGGEVGRGHVRVTGPAREVQRAGRELDDEELNQMRKALADARLDDYRSAATGESGGDPIRFYADESVLDIPPSPAGMLPLATMFDWQWQYWITEDVLTAMSEANGDDDVVNGPMKRLLGLSISPVGAAPAAGAGSSGGGGMGGMGTPGMGRPGGGGGAPGRNMGGAGAAGGAGAGVPAAGGAGCGAWTAASRQCSGPSRLRCTETMKVKSAGRLNQCRPSPATSRSIRLGGGKARRGHIKGGRAAAPRGGRHRRASSTPPADQLRQVTQPESAPRRLSAAAATWSSCLSADETQKVGDTWNSRRAPFSGFSALTHRPRSSNTG